MSALNRRELLASFGAAVSWRVAANRSVAASLGLDRPMQAPVRRATGEVDWRAVRDAFPLTRDWIHLASFLLVSHPRPVADAIEAFRKKIDADPVWIEDAAFMD